MNRYLLASSFASLFVIAPVLVAGEDEYPINQKDRGLILPVGTGEFTIGPAWIEGNRRHNQEANWNFRYSLSKNLEIARVGLRYRFLNQANNEFALALENYGLGYDDTHRSYHHTSFSFEGKEQFNEYLAFTNGIGYFWEDSHEVDGRTHEIRYSIGTIFKLNNRTSLDANYSYRDLYGFNSGAANLLNAILTFNMYKDVDFLVDIRFSDFNEAVDSVIFNESFDSLYSLQIAWRF